MDRHTEENGYLILESTFCYAICMLVIILLLSAGFYLYQLAMVNVVTNEVANEVAQNYKLRYVADSADVTQEDVVTVGKYRYLLFESSFKNAKRATVQRYTTSRLAKTSLAMGDSAPKVTIETVKDDIGRRHYRVTVSQKYTFLFGKILNWIGIEGKSTISASSNVQGTDILNFVNTVKVARYLADGPVMDDLSGLELVDSAIEAVNAGYKLAKAFLK